MNNLLHRCLLSLLVTMPIAHAGTASPVSVGGASSASSDASTNRSRSGDSNANANARQLAFARDTLTINQAFDHKLQTLERRGEDVHLGQALNGAGLASPGGISAGHAAVAKMRHIQDERRQTVREYHRQTRQLLTPDLIMAFGPRVSEALRRRLSDAEQFEKDLDTARATYTDSVELVLSWAERQGDTIQLQNGQISLATSDQIVQLNALFTKVRAAAEWESKLFDKGAPIYQNYLNELQKLKSPPR